MKKLLLIPLSLSLAACGAIQPLGFCSSDGLFYYMVGPNMRSATPAEVQARGFDPYGYGSWCPAGSPTATPTNTAEPPTPTDTAEPPTATPTDTAEPLTPTNTAEPSSPTATWPAPTPTNEPPEREPRVRIERVYLLTEEITGRWCVLLSDTHPSLERQRARCGWPWTVMDTVVPVEAYQANAPCAGPIYDNDVWTCDDDSLEWRMSRWPDAEWLHGLGRDPLEVLCRNYPDYCDG